MEKIIILTICLVLICFSGCGKKENTENLAKSNGVNKITAGLPPKYEVCNFRAEYDSGESIAFSENRPEAFEDYEEVPVWNSVASSQLRDKDYYKYHPVNLYDNDMSTAYVEGADDDGIGQMVLFEFGGSFEASCYAISKIEIRPGYQKSQDTFENNSRPLKLAFHFLNGRVEYAEFDENYDWDSVYTIEFEPVIAKDCIMVIEDAVSGEKYKDLCISEVKFYSQYTSDMIFYEHNIHNDNPDANPDWDINIEAYKGDEPVWSYMTHNPLTELSGRALLTCGYGKVIVYDEQRIVALDALTGEVLWVNEDTGYPSAYTFDDKGNFYVCGYFGSQLCVIDKDGNTIRKEENLTQGTCNWATMLILRPDGNASIYYAQYNDSDEEGKIFTIGI